MSDGSLGIGMDAPPLSWTFLDGKGAMEPFSKFSGASVTFALYPGIGQTALTPTGTASITTLAADGVSALFTWTPPLGGYSTGGQYLGKFIVTFASGRKQEFPAATNAYTQGSFLIITIEPVS